MFESINQNQTFIAVFQHTVPIRNQCKFFCLLQIYSLQQQGSLDDTN